ncbi:hypothetical protein D3C79_915630 [compost metagenome]
MERRVGDDHVETAGNVGIDVTDDHFALDTVGGQRSAAGFHRGGVDVAERQLHLRRQLRQHRGHDAGATAQIQHFALHVFFQRRQQQ